MRPCLRRTGAQNGMAEKHIPHTSVDSDELTVTEILHQIGVPHFISRATSSCGMPILLTMNRRSISTL